MAQKFTPLVMERGGDQQVATSATSQVELAYNGYTVVEDATARQASTASAQPASAKA